MTFAVKAKHNLKSTNSVYYIPITIDSRVNYRTSANFHQRNLEGFSQDCILGIGSALLLSTGGFAVPVLRLTLGGVIFAANIGDVYAQRRPFEPVASENSIRRSGGCSRLRT